MKKSRLYIGLAAIALSIGGVFATKVKKANFYTSSGYFVSRSGVIVGNVTNLTIGFSIDLTNRATVVLTTVGLIKVIATLYTGKNVHVSRLIFHN